ncbi:MAG: DNA internalization-related competence protein ComEC/Rec2 [Deltaproteobacteria bacterium]|nr:DNA internalization-related competence protein ComEC/Rec2 [Deltaproteobacteria bacterium]MBW2179927.1 DNA internalization-related competence protein ComEC/Rec2 [Deltaproteobacteria bacterium]
MIIANLVLEKIEQKPAFLNKLHLCTIFTPFILFAALGYISIQPWINTQFPENHVIHFKDSDKFEIAGKICSIPERYHRRQRFIINTETLRNENKTIKATGKIRVTVYGKGSDVSFGDEVKFISRIKSIRNFNNPGGFDYQRYMSFKRIWTTAYAQADRVDIIERSDSKSGWTLIENYREKIDVFIQDTVEESTSGLLKALMLGDKSGISKYTREAFNRAGVAHVLAISGLHIGIVTMFFFVIFQTIISRFDVFLWNALVKKVAAVLTLFPVLLYGMLSGMSPSTQRAVIMVSVFLITFLFDREQDPINTLALAAFVILTIHPPSLFSISFQLSFITVYFIIYGLSRVNYLNAFHLNWDRFQMCKKILTFLMVSFFAFVGSFPIVMFYFNQVSTVGILANLFVIPLIGFVAVPLGLTSVFLYPIYQPLAAWNLKWSSYVIKKSFSVINFLSDLPFAAIKTITPTILEIICFYLLIWALINLNKNKIVKYLAIGVIFVLIADVAYWVHQRFLHDDLRVTIIDVGQGSSALLEIPGGQTVLIDGGGFSDNSYFDIGERVVGPFLWRKKIKTVDTIILSHPNSDHLNGLIYIAKHFNVKNVWTNGETASTFGYQTFMEVIKEQEINIPVFEKLSRKTILNGVILEIIYPENDFLSKRETDRWRNRNNNSLVLRAKFGSTSIIFPGDLEARAEIDLASIKGNDLKSTILVSPHHGSKSSSSNIFLDKIEPDYVIISSGWRNRFGFPHPKILEKYLERGCKVLRTDLSGAITVTIDGKSVGLETEVQDYNM